jgi:uncharacterized membrane protein YqjE
MFDSTKSHAPKIPRHGLLSGLAGVGKNMLGLLFNRIELAALELAEVRLHLLKLIVVAALGLMALWFALIYWSVLIVLLNWDALGWKILALMAALFSVLAIALFWRAKSMLHDDSLTMPETVNELRKDRDALLAP